MAGSRACRSKGTKLLNTRGFVAPYGQSDIIVRVSDACE